MSRVRLSLEDAESVIPKTEFVHTFVNPQGGILIGTELKREEIMERIAEHGCEIGGPESIRMEHGLVVIEDGRAMFVATTKEIERFERLVES